METAENHTQETTNVQRAPSQDSTQEIRLSSASPDSPPSGSDNKNKRKYEEATHDEKIEMFLHHINNPHLKQREISEWFKAKYGKNINQSTVSRNLKKMRINPPGDISVDSLPEPSPRSKERKPKNPQQTQRKQPQHALPALPSPYPSYPSHDLDNALYDFYLYYRRRNGPSSDAELSRELKSEAQRIISNSERKAEMVIDDTWIEDWKRSHRILPPSPTTSSSSASPPPFFHLEGTPATSVAAPSPRHELPGFKKFVEEVDARTPERMSSVHDLTPSSNPQLAPPFRPSSASSLSPIELEEKRRRKEVRRLRKDVEKYEFKIAKAQNRKTKALERIAELERITKPVARPGSFSSVASTPVRPVHEEAKKMVPNIRDIVE